MFDSGSGSGSLSAVDSSRHLWRKSRSMSCSGSGSGSLSAVGCLCHLAEEELLFAIDFPYSDFTSIWSSANLKCKKVCILN